MDFGSLINSGGVAHVPGGSTHRSTHTTDGSTHSTDGSTHSCTHRSTDSSTDGSAHIAHRSTHSGAHIVDEQRALCGVWPVCDILQLALELQRRRVVHHLYSKNWID